MKVITLILDLDGVLITTPPWKADEIDSDGYSKFNESCIQNLNKLLEQATFEVVLSSTRRTYKTLEEFNAIFSYRNIIQPIKRFVPVYEHCKNRKEAVEQFISDSKLINYIILDDDKSLNGLASSIKENLVLTEYLKGLNKEKLIEAKGILNNFLG